MSSLSEVLAQPYVLFAPRLVVAALLLLGGVGKLANSKEFKEVLFAYKFLPERVVPLFSMVLPVVELIVGAGLLFKLFSPVVEYIAASLFLLFVLPIAVNLLRGRHEIPCGCFGGGAEKISWLMIVRNMAFSGLAFLSLGKLVLISFSLIALYSIAATALYLAKRSKLTPA